MGAVKGYFTLKLKFRHTDQSDKAIMDGGSL